MTTQRNKTGASQAVIRRALLSKQFYGHAVEHSLRTSPIDRMIAVHNFHLSIEILLRAIANEYGVKNYGFLSFSKLLEGIDKSEKARDIVKCCGSAILGGDPDRVFFLR